MVKCWAASLGGCSEKQSVEHFLSRGIWDSNAVGVKGLFTDEDRIIGFGSLGSNILCTQHNNDLSELDEEIRTISDRIHTFYDYFEWRSKAEPNKFSLYIEFRISGTLLERWMFKFLIGLFCTIGRSNHWSDTKTGPLDPPLELVQAAFGQSVVGAPMGLYLAFAAGDKLVHHRGNIEVETILHPDDRGFLGANVDLNGIRFTTWLSRSDIKTFFVKSSSGTIFGPGGESFMYHPRVMNFPKAMQRLKFSWD